MATRVTRSSGERFRLVDFRCADFFDDFFAELDPPLREPADELCLPALLFFPAALPDRFLIAGPRDDFAAPLRFAAEDCVRDADFLPADFLADAFFALLVRPLDLPRVFAAFPVDLPRDFFRAPALRFVARAAITNLLGVGGESDHRA